MSVWVLAAAIVAAVAVFFGIRAFRGWLKYRGECVVSCPENQKTAGMRVDAWHAASHLRVSTCSRWPERAGCGQQCLAQIESAPEDCLVRGILAQWYAGKVCVCCGQPLGDFPWGPGKPALLRPDHRSVEWSGIPAEQLPETLATSAPICFACHTANTFASEHPELVIDRSRSVT